MQFFILVYASDKLGTNTIYIQIHYDNTMKQVIFATLLIPLLVLALSPALFDEASALKATGDTRLSPHSYGSATNVCGDRLCSEMMSNSGLSEYQKDTMFANMNMNMMMSTMDMMLHNMDKMSNLGMMDEAMTDKGTSMMNKMMDTMHEMMQNMKKSTG